MSTNTTLLREAFRPLARVFGDGMTADHTGSKFTCNEADEIALALYVTGHEDAAVTWLHGHADGEDWEDSHAHEYDQAKGDANRESPRTFDEDEIREYLLGQSGDYLKTLIAFAAA
ncbi:hypothetical protein ACFU6R_03140 [Streptomyces sp. NPDC057499]|uniref:hypothetical protein n=1 Tax=Streptomyces sp. NPDC057499 TaxID=3346150 RepID=UPI0036B287A6